MRGATRAIRSTISRSHFNPRSSCEERPSELRKRPSMCSNFNPRSSCEERHERLCHPCDELSISIHAPHARSDFEMVIRQVFQDGEHFNPRSSCEERRRRSGQMLHGRVISIHAPHARSDCMYRMYSIHTLNFNPRSSCEERLNCTRYFPRSAYFNPRSSCEERLSYG